MTAGLLVRRVHGSHSGHGMLSDNWIHVQEADVRLGRLQIFDNWSPVLVADPSPIWLGLEYFSNEGDEPWSMADPTFLDFASRELAKIGLIDRQDIVDGTIVRIKKAHPAYFGCYSEIGRVRDYLNGIENLFLNTREKLLLRKTPSIPAHRA